jgi:alpha-1,6-mannosyltransferase
MTDLPGAYVGPAVRGVAGAWLGTKAERLTERYLRGVFGRCDLICAPSPEQAARVTRIGLDDVHVVPLGVDLETFHPNKRDPAVRAELGAPEEALLLFYAGRLDSEKRVSTMANAARRVNEQRPARLVMAGNGPHREALIEQAEAGAPLIVLPYQEDKLRLARLMASSDLYLTAGPHETFALSVVEAQACGLPVVGVAAGALVERVDDTVGRLGPVDDAAAMAAHILTVAEHLDTMGAAARRHVEERYAWKATFDRLFSMYEEGRRVRSPSPRRAPVS